MGGDALVVSQFTLYGDCRKGRRPSFIKAARPELANALYEAFIIALEQQNIPTQGGTFQAMMDVELVNDGPVTILLDSGQKFLTVASGLPFRCQGSTSIVNRPLTT